MSIINTFPNANNLLVDTVNNPGTILGVNSDGTIKYIKIEDLIALINDYLPKISILLWSGSIGTIPSGWLLCNGTNGTPDLRDRFVVGAGGNYNVGNTGGAASVSLSVAELAAHTHSYTELIVTTDVGSSTTNVPLAFNPSWSQTGSTGSGTAHENRPPYYALCYIMKTI